MKMVTIKLPKWLSNIVLRFMKSLKNHKNKSLLNSRLLKKHIKLFLFFQNVNI